MKKHFTSFLAMVLVILAMAPGVGLAEATPAVTDFKVDKPFGVGVAFTVAVGNVTDFAGLNPTMTLGQIPLTVTGVSKNTIQGVFTEGIPAEGGTIHIRFKTWDVTYELRVPVITGIVADEIAKGAIININGKNFSEGDCTLTVGARSAKPDACHASQIIFTIDKNFAGGDLTVKSNRLTSAAYPFAFNPPRIDFIDSATGIRPEATVSIHGNGFLETMTKNEVYNGTELLTLLPNESTTALLKVKLPKTAVKGFKVISNGIESNTVSADVFTAPVLNSYQKATLGNKTTLTLKGANFSESIGKNQVTCAGKTAKITSVSVNSLEAEMTTPFEDGCLMVAVEGKKSNCVAFKNTTLPVLNSFDDPIFLDQTASYSWTLSAGGQLPGKPSDVGVYVNGAKAETTAIFGQTIKVTLQNPPDKGDVYFTVGGLKSNKLYYNFGARFYPSIKSVSAPGGFAAGQSISIQGNNFGWHRYNNFLSLSLSGVGLAKDGNSYDWKVTPTLITTRLDDNVKAGKEVSLKISFKNKTSNEIRFKTNTALKEVVRSPWVYQLRFPEGMAVGKSIRVEGGGFSEAISGNQVLFDGAKGTVTMATGNVLAVTVPTGAKEKGKLKVMSGGRESNLIDYSMASNPASLLEFRFIELSDKTPVEPDKEATVAQLIVKNALGPLLVRKLKIEMDYSEKNLKNAPPFGEFKLFGQSATLEREGSGYALYFYDLYFLPKAEDQVLDLKTTVQGAASDGASFSFRFNPQDSSALQAFNLDGQVSGAKIEVKHKAIASEAMTVQAKPVSCIDSDSKNSHCAPSSVPPAPAAAPAPEAPVLETQPARERLPLSQDWKIRKKPLIPFSDVESIPEASSISELKKRGVVQGVGGNAFSPNGLVNRAEFLKMTVVGLQIALGGGAGKAAFPDVRAGEWFASYVLWAVENGVVKGYTDGTFGPARPITRAEALKIILAAGGFTIETGSHPFTDTQAWQDPYIFTALKYKLIASGSILKPNEPITRAETAKLIVLMLAAYEKEVP